MANQDRCGVRLAVWADDSYLGRAQRAGRDPPTMLLCPVGVVRRRPEVAEGAHVIATCLIDGPPGDISKALHETIGDVAVRKNVSGIQPADVEGGGPSLEVFVRAEIRKVHSETRVAAPRTLRRGRPSAALSRSDGTSRAGEPDADRARAHSTE